MNVAFAPITAPPAATATAAALAVRQTTVNSCLYNYGDLSQCMTGIMGCISGLGFGGVDTSAQQSSYTSCYCREGPGFLSCYYGGLSSKGCTVEGGAGGQDWQAYQMAWFGSSCGGLPASIQSQMTRPTSVSLSLTTVQTVRLTGTRRTTTSTTPRTTVPPYTGSGSLLAGPCKTTKYLLIDEGSTVFWAPFIGCVSEKPECCPWAAATTAAYGGTAIPTNVTSDTTVTLTTTSTIGGGNTAGGPGADNGQLAAYPSAADAAQQVLKRCPDDYFSYSGGCCPAGYWPFTKAVGGQTPCWSSTTRNGLPPAITLTDGLDAGLGPSSTTRTSSTRRNETSTTTSSTSSSGATGADGKPTSAVVNIVWAVQYAVEPGSGSGGSGLSTGAIAGIAVGAVAAVAIVLAWFLFRSRRNNSALKAETPAVVADPAPGVGDPTVAPNAGTAPMQPQMQPQMVMMAPEQQYPQQQFQPYNGQQPVFLDPNAPAGATRSATVSSISSGGTGAALMQQTHPSSHSHSHSGTTSPGPNGGGYPAPITEEPGMMAAQGQYFDPTQQQQQHLGGAMVPPGQPQPGYYYVQQPQQGMVYPQQYQQQPQGGVYPQQYQEQVPYQPQQTTYAQQPAPQPSTSPIAEAEAGGPYQPRDASYVQQSAPQPSTTPIHEAGPGQRGNAS